MTEPGTPRQIYLFKTLKLSHDPFATPVAEQELHRSQRVPHFFSYFIDPTAFQDDKPLPQVLREARNGLIFGAPGSGKTTLRYILEENYRAVYDRSDLTLVVTYELSHKFDQLPTVQNHWANLSRELAIDLFIQVIERIDSMAPPDEAQLSQLRGQIARVGPRLYRLIERILVGDFFDSEAGLDSLWPSLNRPAVRHIPFSDKIKHLLERCLPAGQAATTAQQASGLGQLKAGLAAAKAWGFTQVTVLIDGVDARQREPEAMLGLVEPLLTTMATWQEEALYFFFFLPLSLQPIIADAYGKTFCQLRCPPLLYRFDWQKETLLAMLRRRLHEAGSQLPGLNALGTGKLQEILEDRLIEAAHNSPRQLLLVVSALIDAHAQAGATQLRLTPQDWEQMRRSWGYDEPVPPSLIRNGSSA